MVVVVGGMGSFGGALQLRPTGLWPDAQTPVQGVLQANVAQLATWGPWVPAGWRLAGRVGATLQLGGRAGAPDLVGQVLQSFDQRVEELRACTDEARIALWRTLIGLDFKCPVVERQSSSR